MQEQHGLVKSTSDEARPNGIPECFGYALVKILTEPGVVVWGARVVATDVETSSGVIHISSQIILHASRAPGSMPTVTTGGIDHVAT